MNTAKLSDKQTNIACAVIAGLLFLGFGAMTYFDYEELLKVESDTEAKKVEIKQAEIKRDQIPDLKATLWYMKKKYEHFKEMLPTQQESAAFYAKLDKYRIEKGIKPWKSLSTKATIIETAEEEKKSNDPQSMQNKTETTKPKKPAPQGKNAPKQSAFGEFIETTYYASVSLTFDQLLQFLNTIENDKRFYGIQEIKMSGSKGAVTKTKNPKDAFKELGNPDIETDLVIVSFTYTGDMPVDKEVTKFIDDKYKPPLETQEKLNSEIKIWESKEDFSATHASRNPFDKEQVLQRIIQDISDKNEEIKNKISPLLPAEQLKREMERIQDIRNKLHILAVAESWSNLQEDISKLGYDKMLENIQATKDNDPQGLISEKIIALRKELSEWNKAILSAGQEEKARRLLAKSKQKLQEIDLLYEEGKKNGIQKNFEKIISIHNEIMPQLREVSDWESKIPELGNVRKEVEIKYSKAETQIKIMQLATKLKLEGIIYLPNFKENKDSSETKDMSVVFINKKLMRKNEIIMGFVIQSIEEDKIILRYKEETVPLQFKRLPRQDLSKDKKSVKS